MTQFTDKWQKQSKEPLRERLKESIKGPEPLRPKLEDAVRRIQGQISKLANTESRLKEKDAALFKKVVTAMQRHDTQTAAALSNELSELRKMMKIVGQASVALEQITMRLGTVQEMGDIATVLAPTLGVMKSVRSGLGQVMPEAEHEIGEVNSMLSSILVDAGQIGGLTMNFDAANEEAEKILAEAAAVAEQNMKEKFPELPVPSSYVSKESGQA